MTAMKCLSAVLAAAALCLPPAAMADCSVPQKVTLGDTSPATPSIVSLNGVMFVAWNGTDSAHRLNVMSSTDHGMTFANKFTSSETSPVAPVLTVHNGQLYIAWSGTGNRQLNVARVNIQNNRAIGFSQKRTLADTSPSSPSLASLGGRLYLAWNGTDAAHRLNMLYSADGGATFGGKHTSNETSASGPALAVQGGQLYITWTGSGNLRLNVAKVNTPNVNGFSQKRTLADTSPATPSLISRNGRLFVAWNGRDSAHRLNVMSSADDGQTFGNKYIYGETSPVAPALAVHNDLLYIAWRGTGNSRLNVARINEMPVGDLSLNVALRPQETSNWCWAASGQMVMEFLGCNNVAGCVAQCVEANDYHGQTNCCTIALCPNPAAAQLDAQGNCIGCVCGGWPQFDQYGFTVKRTNEQALTWVQLSDQMNCQNKPVAFSWRWVGGGGHMMVARGLRQLADGTQWVQINDPWGPCQGDVRYISYAVYNELTNNHTHWDDFYDITRR